MNNPETIPALSLWQPYASLIALGAKRIETRGWETRYRGPLAIHAAKRCLKNELIYYACRWDVCAALAPLGKRMGDNLNLWDILPFGAVVAVADLTGCRPTSSFTALELDARRFQPGAPQIDTLDSWSERGFGDYSLGRFGWVLENVRALPCPIPLTGHQGLFRVDAQLFDVK